ncbi:ATP-grasp domain-containing protein [Streptomyces beigongshangae]|uniref:ATP-grasp domain-containing protein n=1 Tax=Streptomyces beigongshangae TaxID=2841597 RepID=UPI001C855C0F|nr:ATP-grasp domain-containing protein [Streptomyces sp. REN17]
MIALVDPLSSGVFLSSALRERGQECMHLYGKRFSRTARSDASAPVLIMSGTTADTVAALRDRDIRHVVPGSEFGVAAAHDLAAALNLPRNEDGTAAARRDKALMGEALRRAGMPGAGQATVETVDDLTGALRRLGLPVVVKPSQSSGSDGCRVCWSETAAVTHFRDIHRRMNLVGLPNDRIFVQEYLPGEQYVVTTVSLDGRHVVCEVARNVIEELDGLPVRRYNVSCPTLGAAERDVVSYTLGCLDALGIRHGAANADVRLTGDGPRLVEVNARILGPVLHPDPYFAAFGGSQQHLLAESLDDPASFRARSSLAYAPPQVMGKAFVRCWESGVLTAVPGLSSVRRLPGFHSARGLPRVGRAIRQSTLTKGRTGIVYFVHPQESVVRRSLEALREMEDERTLFRVTPAPVLTPVLTPAPAPATGSGGP